jgi:hypothetical protein
LPRVATGCRGSVWHYSVTRAGFAFLPGPLTAAVVAGLLSAPARVGSPRAGALRGLIYALSSVWCLSRLGSESRYLAEYLPGALVGGTGIGLVLPALTALATATLPPARLATGIGVQTTFRQIGAALGLSAFVALVAGSTLAAKSDFDRAWLFMAVIAACTGLLFMPLFQTRAEPVAAEPAATADPRI